MPLTVEEFRRRVEALEPISFDDGTPDDERTIPAAWIKALFPEPQRVATHPIRIKNAIIEGDLLLPYARAPYEIEITGCTFTGKVRFAQAVIERAMDLSDCRFADLLSFRFAQFNSDLFLRRCECEGKANFNDVVVRRLCQLSGTRFGGVFDMERANVTSLFCRVSRSGDALRPTRFEKRVRFHDLHAKYFDAQGVQFGDESLFHRLTVEDIAMFNAAASDDSLEPIEPVVTRFGGKVVFRHAHFGREADFSGAHFAAEVDFQAARVAGRFLLEGHTTEPWKYPTRFDGRADFSGMEVESLWAGGSLFGGECNMNRLKVGPAKFSFTRDDRSVFAVFKGEFNLQNAQLGDADFRAVQFQGPANFHNMRAEGSALFDSAWWTKERAVTSFAKEANFYRMRLGGDFWCEGAEFRGPVNCSFMSVTGVFGFADDHHGARWRATIAGPVRFEAVHAGDLIADGIQFAPGTTFREMHVDRVANLEGAQFAGDADLRAMTVGGKLTLESATVAGDLLLRDARVGAFAAPRQLAGGRKLDARGFTFDRIDGDVRELLRRQDPYDLRLYEQAERFVRDSGNEELAGALYLDRRRRETRGHWKALFDRSSTARFSSLLLALYGVLQDVLFRYGVRPLRLLVLSIVVVLFGMWVFQHDGAVQPREKGAAARDLTWSQALGYSARTFIPIGDLPSGSQLIATENTLPRSTLTFEGYATIQRLLGLVLVPLGVAAITGLLVRKR
jgi:uncharacterized protein YjbI with pentapeptide repeats